MSEPELIHTHIARDDAAGRLVRDVMVRRPKTLPVDATVGELRALVLDRIPGRRIGYVTDLRYTEANAAALERLLGGADLLYVEAVFSEADADHGARKNHLTTRQAGLVARRLGARHVVPFHFSPRYRGAEDALRAEVERARAG